MVSAQCEKNGTLYTKIILSNICDPCDEDNDFRTCSYACLDVNYTSRIGRYYSVESDFDLAKCPEYWQNVSNKIEIEPAALPLEFVGKTATIAYCSGFGFTHIVFIKSV